MKCKDCKKRDINIERSSRCCDVCLDKRTKSQNEYYIKHKTEYIKKSSVRSVQRVKKLKVSGRCVRCGKVRDSGHINFCSVCLEKDKIFHKTYRQNNKKKIQESQKRSMAKKPEVYKAIKHKTYENNKDNWYRWGRERRDRKLKAEGSYTKQEWVQLLDTYGHSCLCCGKTDRIEADHVVPLSKGGTDYITNIQPLCRICNSSKGTKTIDYRPFLVSFGS